MTCIYCAGRSRDQNMTLEHIWPQSLGGVAAPPIFQTRDVCQKCNSNCGLFVDGAFLKSWFISAERGASAHDYLDPRRPGPAPFWYHGIDTEFPVADGDVCERWLGMAGEHVYHVHRQDDERWSPYAGGDVIRRKADPGRVYIWLTSPTAYWAQTALMSLIQQFPKARRRCMTRIDGLPALPVAMPSDAPESDAERREADWVDKRVEGIPHTHKVALKIDFSDRFLAKLSLGLGHTIVGVEASSGAYADELRKLLWSRDPSSREDVGVRGSGFWDTGPRAEIPEIIKWKGAWCLLLTGLPEGFGMALTTPSGRFMSMMISDDPALVGRKADPVLLSGAIFLFAPQREIAVGPVPIFEFIAHRLGNLRHPDLTALEQMRTTLSSLPAKKTSGASNYALGEGSGRA